MKVEIYNLLCMLLVLESYNFYREDGTVCLWGTRIFLGGLRRGPVFFFIKSCQLIAEGDF